MALEEGTETSLDDGALLAKVALKDKSAFESLYRSYYHRVFQFVLRMAKNPQLSEEVVNDTMFTIWEKAHSFESRSSVSTWILGIAYRRTLKALQKNKRHQQKLDLYEDALATYPDPKPDSTPEALLATESLTAQIQYGINRLSINQRSVMQLSAMGYAYHEIADIMDCPENTVKTRMFHARRQLKVFLEQLSDEDTTNSGCKKLWSSKQQTTISIM